MTLLDLLGKLEPYELVDHYYEEPSGEYVIKIKDVSTKEEVEQVIALINMLRFSHLSDEE